MGRRADLIEPSRPSVPDALDLQNSTKSGLSAREAAVRLERFGPNELPQPRREGLGRRILRQFIEPMAILLLAAAAVSGFGLGKGVDAFAILAIVAANVVIALIQEGKAASALEALRAMETPTATVVRDGDVLTLPTREVVVGDLVVLAAGDRVPADLRLVDTAATEIDESILTGESLPVPKDADAPGGIETGLADQHGMAFAGTLVVHGSTRGLVIATGGRTQLGLIADSLEQREQRTPLQGDLRSMTLRLGIVAAGIAAAVFGITLIRLGSGGGGLETAFLSAAALAVAAVPEGLPTVVTVALALGVKRMASHGSIIRRLPAVETLGATTVILTDKTGTLTENRMRVDAFLAPDGTQLNELDPDRFEAVAEILALCNDATLEPATGDPMEIAMLEAIGASRVVEMRLAHPRSGTVPFDSESKRMTTQNAYGPSTLALMKGAPESVVPMCTSALGGLVPIGGEERERMLKLVEDLAGAGRRVLALARREVEGVDDPVLGEGDFALVGFVTLRDGVRPEARGAVADARRAGIRVLMVTGDHPGTAIAIAREVGLTDDGVALTGSQLRRDGMPVDPLDVPVYARVDPDEKLALTEALQALGHVVAVTGDGVNDAPALRRADIGVAMGRAGSDVAREAADMVVTDDNLATIVTAVREGRGIYDNIRKVVEYLVAGNLSEILVVVLGLLLFPQLGVPLLPLQLLWINLLTDGFPALALGVDPVDPTLMDRAPRGRSDRLLSGHRLSTLMVRAVLIAAASIGSLAIARFAWDEPWSHARASMFSVLMTAHLLYAFAVRSQPRGARRNGWLMAAVVGGIALQVLIVSVPAFHGVFGTAHLSLREWLLVAGMGAAPALAMRIFLRPKVGGPDRSRTG